MFLNTRFINCHSSCNLIFRRTYTTSRGVHVNEIATQCFKPLKEEKSLLFQLSKKEKSSFKSQNLDSISKKENALFKEIIGKEKERPIIADELRPLPSVKAKMGKILNFITDTNINNLDSSPTKRSLFFPGLEMLN